MSFDSIVDSASKSAGWTDLGPAGGLYLEGLGELYRAVMEDPSVTRIGRATMSGDMLKAFTNCFATRRLLAENPGVANFRVERPVFIVGFGRTGSTLLQNLMGLDPLGHAPLLWELWRPTPSPENETYHGDPRINEVSEELDLLMRWAPELADIHPMAALSPDECHWLMPLGPHLFLRYRAPQLWRWMKSLSKRDRLLLYEDFRLRIQLLQYRRNPGHWIGKSFVHQFFYPVMFDVFPDAHVVRLHRDPCECIPSLASLFSATRRISYANRMDRDELGTLILDFFVDGSLNAIEADQVQAPERFVDIIFDDLVKDPQVVVGRIYEAFGYPFSLEFQRRIKTYLQEDRQRSKDASLRPKPHKYSADRFGLSPQEIRLEAEEYLSWLQEKCPAALYA